MEQTPCPSCRQAFIHVSTTSNGSERSTCPSCGWVGGGCFGKLHNPNDAKCAGGFDPTYWARNTSERKRCPHFDQCMHAMSLQTPKQQVEVKGAPFGTPGLGAPGLVTPQMPQMPQMPPRPQMPQMPTQSPHPVLPQTQAMPAPTPVQVPVQQPQQQQTIQQALQANAAQQQAARQAAGTYNTYGTYAAAQPGQVPVYLVPPQYAGVPGVVPQNHVQPGAQVASYLTVPEPYNGRLGPMFLNSILRGGLKGMFSTAANMVDHIPWGEYGPPPGT